MQTSLGRIDPMTNTLSPTNQLHRLTTVSRFKTFLQQLIEAPLNEIERLITLHTHHRIHACHSTKGVGQLNALSCEAARGSGHNPAHRYEAGPLPSSRHGMWRSLVAHLLWSRGSEVQILSSRQRST